MDNPPPEAPGMFTWDARKSMKDKGLLLAGFTGVHNRGEEAPWKRARRLGGGNNKAIDRRQKK